MPTMEPQSGELWQRKSTALPVLYDYLGWKRTPAYQELAFVHQVAYGWVTYRRDAQAKPASYALSQEEFKRSFRRLLPSRLVTAATPKQKQPGRPSERVPPQSSV